MVFTVFAGSCSKMSKISTGPPSPLPAPCTKCTLPNVLPALPPSLSSLWGTVRSILDSGCETAGEEADGGVEAGEGRREGNGNTAGATLG
jgi:hypothetical protein